MLILLLCSFTFHLESSATVALMALRRPRLPAEHQSEVERRLAKSWCLGACANVPFPVILFLIPDRLSALKSCLHLWRVVWIALAAESLESLPRGSLGSFPIEEVCTGSEYLLLRVVVEASPSEFILRKFG